MYTGFRLGPTKFNEFGSLKLIACATLTGICRYMTRDDNWRNQNEPYPGAHCHAANDLMEYVVFDDAQIIPCYVIHLEQRRKAQHAVRMLYGLSLEPGDEKRRKEALLAKASKYFP